MNDSMLMVSLSCDINQNHIVAAYCSGVVSLIVNRPALAGNENVSGVSILKPQSKQFLELYANFRQGTFGLSGFNMNYHLATKTFIQLLFTYKPTGEELFIFQLQQKLLYGSVRIPPIRKNPSSPFAASFWP